MLAQQPHASSSQRSTNREFLAASRGARYEKIGYIKARDEQQADSSREQYVKRALHIPHQVLKEGPAVRFCGDKRVVQV